jgi:hypothetical protein
VEYSDGTKEWYVNGERHRLGGPAVERIDGSEEWWVNGGPHRETGPAMSMSDGSFAWYWNGRCHRWDGPAYVSSTTPGDVDMWWWRGDLVSEEEHRRCRKIAEKVQKWCARRWRWRETRKFVRLCRSREFVEHWYGEGGMGRRWDLTGLEKCTL